MVTGIKIFNRDDQTTYGNDAIGLKLTAHPHNSVFTEGPQICAYDDQTICLTNGKSYGGILMMLHGDYVCFKRENQYVDFDINDLIALKALLNK